MIKYTLLSAMCLSLIACSPNSDSIQVEIILQQRKVASAKRNVDREASRLKVMEDSFRVKVQQDQDLGMPKKKADAIERLLVQTQHAVVEASQVNLKRQQEHLDELKKHAKSP